MKKKVLTIVLVISVCFILVGAAYSSEAKSVKIEKDYSPLAKGADISIESIRSNECMDDATKIKSTINLFLQLKTDQICNWDFEDYDFDKYFNTASSYYSNLIYSSAKTKLYKEIWKNNSVEILWSSTNVTFENVEISSDSAVVDAYSSMQYISNSYENGISSIGAQYHFSLIKLDGIWLFDNITTPDDIDRIISYDELVDWISEIEDGVEIAKYNNNGTLLTERDNSKDLNRYDPNWTMHYMSTTSFAQYALAYSSNIVGANYNSNFYNYANDPYNLNSGDCANFASQCIWYGLGGVNTSSMIGNHRYWPMVYIEDNYYRNWFQDGTWYSFDEAGAWGRVTSQYNYLVAGGSFTDGPFGTGYSGIAYARKGDLIQVSMNGNGIYDHTYVVTNVSGTTGSRTPEEIYVCSHTTDMNNVQFSNVYSSNKSYRTIQIGGSWEYTGP